MTNPAQPRPETAPRELTAAEMQQAGGGAGIEIPITVKHNL